MRFAKTYASTPPSLVRSSRETRQRGVRRVKKFFRFIGGRPLLWLAIGASASVCLSAVEWAITIFLQAFLKTLGLSAAPVKILGVIDNWNPGHIELAISLLIIGIIRSASTFFICQSAVVTNEAINSRLRLAQLYELLQGRSQKFVSAATINLNISEIFPKAAQFANSGAYIVANAIICTAMACFLFHLAWREAIIGITGLGFVGLIILKMNRRVAEAAAEMPVAQLGLLSGIQRVARNWLLVRILRTNTREYNRLVKNILSYTAASFRGSYYTYFGAILPSLLGIFLIVAILLGHYRYHNVGGAEFLSFLYLFIRFATYLGNLAGFVGAATSTFPQFKRASLFFLSLPQTEVAAAIAPLKDVNFRGAIKPRALESSDRLVAKAALFEDRTPPMVAVTNLGFSYGSGTPPVVSDLSFAIGRGEQFAIVGKSGSGKSTLVSLLLGILHPESGKILIDNQTPEEWFKDPIVRLGYVGAEPFLIDGSIRENLCYGAQFIVEDSDCWEALRKASLADTVRALPGGLNYPLAENGDGLSAGQKQRLALARALLSSPPMLVLDEISANLDDATEAEITEAIRSLKGSATVLIVSHRPGIIKYADQTLHVATLAQASAKPS